METTNNNPKKENIPNSPAFSDFYKTSRSKFFKITVVILIELILLIGTFSLGIQVGFRKAFFTYAWSQNYPNNFGGRTLPVVPPPSGQFFNAHGLDGVILRLDNGSLVIKDEDNTEKTISISPVTVIRQNFQSLTAKDLKTGEEIVIIGDANPQGQIDAKLIRVLDQK